MGWRDINMSRRNPQPKRVFIPLGPGEDKTAAVLRKAAELAVSSLEGQATGHLAPSLRPFLAGYLAGYARQKALTLGFDGEEAIPRLMAEVAERVPAELKPAVTALRFGPRASASPVSRARLSAEDGFADAGYLVGHLEALCGTQKLVRLAIERLGTDRASAANLFLTDCDIAADPLQTREPTKSLRFSPQERAVIREAFDTLS